MELFVWAFPFLKKKGAGLEFILSPVEGFQSFPIKIGKGFPLQSLTQRYPMTGKFYAFIRLQTEKKNRTQVLRLF